MPFPPCQLTPARMHACQCGRASAAWHNRCQWMPNPTRIGHRDVACSAFMKMLKNIVKSEPVTDQLDPQFASWLKQHDVNTDMVALQACGTEGRGLVARRRIHKGQQVLQVPGQLVIDASTASSGSSILNANPGVSLSEWSTIAAFLAELRFWSGALISQPTEPRDKTVLSTQQSKATQAAAQTAPAYRSHGAACSRAVEAALKWAPYVAVLPSAPGTVLEWPPGEAGRLLEGSSLNRRAARIQSAAAATWAELQPLVHVAEQAGVLPVGAVKEADIRWALGIMLSRLIRLSGLADRQALVPWADFLNHSPASRAHLDWQGSPALEDAGTPSSGGVVLYADRDYAPGEQVYISYGEKSSGELLMSYGFTPPSIPQHPHEAAWLRLSLREDDRSKASKVAALAQCGLPAACEFPLRMDGLPAGLLQWAILCAPASSLPAAWDVPSLMSTLFPDASRPINEELGLVSEEDAYALVAAAAGTAPAQALPPELQLAGFKELAACCTTALKGLPDKNDATVASGSDRAAICAAIRMQERRILARVQFVAQGQARELNRGAKRRSSKA